MLKQRDDRGSREEHQEKQTNKQEEQEVEKSFLLSSSTALTKATKHKNTKPTNGQTQQYKTLISESFQSNEIIIRWKQRKVIMDQSATPSLLDFFVSIFLSFFPSTDKGSSSLSKVFWCKFRSVAPNPSSCLLLSADKRQSSKKNRVRAIPVKRS